MRWPWQAPAPTPCPSDILASLVIARMIMSPERVQTRVVYTSRVATWKDEETGISVAAETTGGDGFSSCYGEITLFAHRGRALAPSSQARCDLRVAIDQCLRQQHSVQEAQRQYLGDMTACDAIQELTA